MRIPEWTPTATAAGCDEGPGSHCRIDLRTKAHAKAEPGVQRLGQRSTVCGLDAYEAAIAPIAAEHRMGRTAAYTVQKYLKGAGPAHASTVEGWE